MRHGVAVADLFNLSGRTAIVTGGSRGLGREMAEGLAEAGALLMLCARRLDWLTPTIDEFRTRGFTVDGMACDVSKPDEVQAVVDKTIALYGKADILVNNAGVSWGAEPEAMPLDKWQKVLDINLTGTFLFAQAAGREMQKRRFGRIINVASAAGLHASVKGPHYVGYTASKAGVMGLTRELAASWGRHGIRVNAIAPGFFPFTPHRACDRRCRAAAQSVHPTGAYRRGGRAQGRGRLPRGRCLELHHRPGDCRRRRDINRGSLTFFHSHLSEFELRDRLAVHFVRAVGEPERARVRPGRGEEEVVADAGRAVRLDGAVDDAQRHVRRDDLDHRDLGARGLVADGVHHVRRLQRQQPRLLDLHARLGDVGADRALLGERLAEGDPRLHPPAHRFERALGQRR